MLGWLGPGPLKSSIPSWTPASAVPPVDGQGLSGNDNMDCWLEPPQSLEFGHVWLL